MPDPAGPGSRDPYDDPYERGKLDGAYCGWVFLGGFVIVLIGLLVTILSFASDGPNP